MSWFRFNTYNSNSSYIYGYVAALQMLRIGTGVLALTGVISLKSSAINEVQTQESGE